MKLVHGRIGVRRGGMAPPGVWVTDGRAWAQTDDAGRYTLAAGGPHVWVRRPDGWDCSAWWRPVADAGDFELEPAPVRRVSRVAHLSDPHLIIAGGGADGDAAAPGDPRASSHDGGGTEAALRRALRLAAQRGADLAVVTGDLTDHGTRAQLRRYADLRRDSPIPVLDVPGNHDHYGHLHEPAPEDAPRGAGFLGSATVTRYEDVLGPRWWSAAVGGLHVIGLDWFSMYCDIDVDEQRAFVVADLARVPAGTPVIVLSHDQLPPGFVDRLRRRASHVRLIGLLSGHWHAPKVTTEPDAIHVSTGPTGFGGLDWSPPQFRMLTWDGHAVAAAPPTPTIPLPTAPRPAPVAPAGVGAPGQASPPRRVAIGARQHLGNLVAAGDTLLVPSQGDDGTAAVTALDAGGHVRWRHDMGEAHVTGMAVHGDTAVLVSCSGTVEAVSTRDGRRHWTHALPDTPRRRIVAAPAVTPCAAVVVGDLGQIVALELDTGTTRWRRDDLGIPDTLLTYGSAVATADEVVLPFGGPARGLVCLRLADGATVWTDEPSPPWPSTSIVAVDGGDGLVVRGGLGVKGRAALDRVHLRTGARVWRCQLPADFITATPVVRDDHAVVITGDGLAIGVAFDRGAISDTSQLVGRREGWAPFRSGGVGAPTGPVELDGGLLVTLIDGSIWDVGGGTPRPAGDVGMPVTTQPTAWAERLAVLDMVGTLHLIDAAAPAAGI